MKYYLAIDKGRSTLPDKSDRYEIIDLNKIPNFRNPKETDTKFYSIDRINEFTSRFDTEEALKVYLINNNLLDVKYINKSFTICYKGQNKKQEFEKIGKGSNASKSKDSDFNQSDVLFKDEIKLFTVEGLTANLIYRSVKCDGSIDIFAKDTSLENKTNYSILKLLVKELRTNDFYQYDLKRIDDDVRDIEKYLSSIRYYHQIESGYNIFIENLVKHMAYSYDEFDLMQENPLLNKSGEIIINKRHFYEFVIYYVYLLRIYEKKINEKLRENVVDNKVSQVNLITLEIKDYIILPNGALIPEKESDTAEQLKEKILCNNPIDLLNPFYQRILRLNENKKDEN